MPKVVAIVDQHSCTVCRSIDEAPPGSTTFSSPEELAASMTVQAMDSVRGKLLNVGVEPSPSRELAAARLWKALLLDADIRLKDDWYDRYSSLARKDSFGNRKWSDVTPTELLQLLYRPEDPMKVFFYRKFPRSIKKIIDLLVEDGRGIWTLEQVNEILRKHEGEITAKKDRVFNIFRLYRSLMIVKKMLRRVKYLEFVSDHRFKGYSLLDKSL